MRVVAVQMDDFMNQGVQSFLRIRLQKHSIQRNYEQVYADAEKMNEVRMTPKTKSPKS